MLASLASASSFAASEVPGTLVASAAIGKYDGWLLAEANPAQPISILTTRDGRRFFGHVRSETATGVQFETTAGTVEHVSFQEIATIVPAGSRSATTSPAPSLSPPPPPPTASQPTQRAPVAAPPAVDGPSAPGQGVAPSSRRAALETELAALRGETYDTATPIAALILGPIAFLIGYLIIPNQGATYLMLTGVAFVIAGAIMLPIRLVQRSRTNARIQELETELAQSSEPPNHPPSRLGWTPTAVGHVPGFASVAF